MLRPVLLLSAVALVTVSGKTINTTELFNISSCPITYYGQQFDGFFIRFGSSLELCFKELLKATTRPDCIYLPSARSVTFRISNETVTESFPNMTGTANCSLKVEGQASVGNFSMSIINFGTQAVMSGVFIGKMDFVVSARGSMMTEVKFTSPNSTKVVDLSGCRDTGMVFKPGSVVRRKPEDCFTRICDLAANFQDSECSPMETCMGNGSCQLLMCTVTANTIIDIYGQQNAIKDRCSYALLSSQKPVNFQLLANFRDRRRKDVSFLESVVLQLHDENVRIHLEQGGKALLNETMLTLNSSDQSVHGATMSKDRRGVTAKVSLWNCSASLFFDGHMAQIHIQGSGRSVLGGLCMNSSSSPLSVRRPDRNNSCLRPYPQSPDSSINCTAMLERCNLLMQPPFNACHQHSDPQPFIDACNQTLCRYPAVDGLNCQFLEAYARTCQLHSVALQSWRSGARCPSPGIFCPNKTCSDHEFCGEKTPGGDTRCFCRAIFASKYNNTLGDPTVCDQNSATVSLVGCLLEDKGIKYSALRLNDDTCRGQMDPVDHMVTFSFNGSNACGADITTDGNKIIYTNTIKTGNTSTGVITRQDQVNINFSCVHTQPEVQTVAFRIKDSSVIQNITSGAWNYTLTMTAYSDGGLSQALSPNTAVQLNQKIWVELDTAGLEGGLVALVTDSCWATKDKPSNSSVRHDLITGGCADSGDNTVAVTGNGLGTSNSFSFNMFQFSGSSGDVYLHCKLELCVKTNKSCKPNCSGANRRRRAVRYDSTAAGFISMTWKI